MKGIKGIKMQGIWKYEELFSYNVLEKYRVTKNEGSTPLLRLGFLEKETGIPYIYAKREDKNPTGSSKDRSLAFLISYLKSKKIENIVVPSSGNTAISAIAYSKLADINLDIFISDKLSKEKTKRLAKYIEKNSKKISIHQSKKPLSDAFKYSKEKNITLLRGSKDKYAIEGFKTISKEIENIRADSIFIPVSSGTTLYGISKSLSSNCQIHLVQTSKINTLSKFYDNDFIKEDNSLCDSIVARVTERKKKVIDVIKKSRGWGWTIQNEEIKKAQEQLIKNDIFTSPEGALTVAGLKKALKKGYKFNRVILLFTGSADPDTV